MTLTPASVRGEKDRRVELNRERRRRGIYGKGGPDVSHTSSGDTVLEAPSKNRARNGEGGRRLKADSPWAVGFSSRQDAPENGKGQPCGNSHIPKTHKCSKNEGVGALAPALAVGAGLLATGIYAKYKWGQSDNKEIANAKQLSTSKPKEKELIDEVSKSTIGSGAAGDVFISKDGKSVFKRIRFPEGVFTPEQQQNKIQKEIDAHIKAQEAGASVPRLEAFDASKNLIKMERLVDYKPLKEQLQTADLSSTARQASFKQLANSFVRLQEAGVAHQDLHSLNIMMNNKGDIKIIDFGQARFTGNRLESALKGDWHPILSNLARIDPSKQQRLQAIAEQSQQDRKAALALLKAQISDNKLDAILVQSDSPWAMGFDAAPCWEGYQQIGMKRKGKKRVPNCVPVASKDAEDGKKYTKVVTNPETGRKNKVRYGAQGYRIAPGTDKGDRYCARSFGDMKSHGKDCSGPDHNTPLCLSRAKWKCSGKSSRRS